MTKSAASELSDDGRDVKFHINYSGGTAAVRGSQPMTDMQCFWEIKMVTPVYGTDMVSEDLSSLNDLHIKQTNCVCLQEI